MRITAIVTYFIHIIYRKIEVGMRISSRKNRRVEMRAENEWNWDEGWDGGSRSWE